MAQDGRQKPNISYEREQGILGALLLYGKPALDVARAAGWSPELARRPQVKALGVWLVEEVEAGAVVDIGTAFDRYRMAPPQLADAPGFVEAVELLSTAGNLSPVTVADVAAYAKIVVEAYQADRLAVLQAELMAASRAGDFAQVAKVAAKIATLAAPPASKPARPKPAEPEGDDRPDPAALAALKAIPRCAKKDDRVRARTVLSADPRWAGRVWYDSMRGRQMLGDEAWADHLDGEAALWLSTTYGIKISSGLVREVLAGLAQANRRHPLQAYLSGLTWDGQSRIDTWLCHALGVADAPIVRAVGRRWMIQAVARAMRPGCQADATLVLVGEQGIRKSSVVGALAGVEFFSESPLDIHGDHADLVSLVHSAWIHDMSEGADVRRADIDRLKQFLTSRVDITRKKYGRNHEERPRFSVFVSTTNDDRFLPADPSGARRFWPATCTSGDVAWAKANRDQLWAEAMVALAAGEQWYLTDEERELLVNHQAGYEQDDAVRGRVRRWLRDNSVRFWVSGVRNGRDPVTTEDIMSGPMGLTVEQMAKRANEMRAGDVLKRLGYVRRRVRSGGELDWGYVPAEVGNEPVES